MLLTQLLPLLAARGAPEALAVAAAAAVGPAQVAGRLGLVALGDARRASSLSLAASLAAACASGALLLSALPPVAAVCAFVALQGGSIGALTILRPAVTAELLGTAGFGGVAGRLATPWLVAYAAAPALGGWLWSVGGDALLLRCTIGLALFSALCLAAARRS